MLINNLKEKLSNLMTALNRYPVLVVLLLAITALNIYMIESGDDTYINVLLALIIGVVLSLVAQQIYEQFFTGKQVRMLLQVSAVFLMLGYYFAIRSVDLLNMELEIKTVVVLFSLMMIFIWIPSIKSSVLFNQTFMATFKAFFTTVLFTAVIAIGLNLSIFAVEQLIVAVHYKVYSHVLNIIFVLFSPLFFLSLIPIYPRKGEGMTAEQEEEVSQAVSSPKVLEVLLSYVVVPLAWLYTLILVVYVLLNISGDFWTDNLLEPMLVSYSITIIIITILISSLENPFALWFRKILPKFLLPIVLFQLIASALKIGEVGVTHGRYYVLLFGLFALLTSVIFSFFPIRKSGWIAAILIVFSIISIVPPVDAFTVSRVNQTNLLKQTLIDNEMWQEGEIVPNADIPVADKKKITQTVKYLNRMRYSERIDWLPSMIHFNETFGFHEVYEEKGKEQYNGQSSYLDWEESRTIDVDGYHKIIQLHINYEENDVQETTTVPMKINDMSYRLEEVFEEGEMYLQFSHDEKKLLRFNLTEAFHQVMEAGESLDVNEATITEENEEVRMSVITNFIDQYDTHYNAEIYVLIEVK